MNYNNNQKQLTEKGIMKDKIILITGGTGSLGKELIPKILEQSPKKVIVFSRDELKQLKVSEMYKNDCLRLFLGDVRDYERLHMAFNEVDIVIHAAALKQVPSCEYNPYEAIYTNILGAVNVIRASINCKVKKVLALSTDKAVNPNTLYGATKLCSDKLFVSSNVYSNKKNTKFSVCRYGNVIGSRGSVLPIWEEQKKTGTITLTDPKMTRFWISMKEAVDFVMTSIEMMEGGEIFIPKIPSLTMKELAEAVAPDKEFEQRLIGIRPGEKKHELMISEDQQNVYSYDDRYIIYPDFDYDRAKYGSNIGRFEYCSGNNPITNKERIYKNLKETGFLYESKKVKKWTCLSELN